MAIVLNQGAQPVKCDIVLYQGDYFEAALDFRGPNGEIVDITGYTGLAEIRDTAKQLVGNFDVEIVGSEGRAIIRLQSDAADALAEGKYKWDFELSDTSTPPKKRTYFVGEVTVTEDISG